LPRPPQPSAAVARGALALAAGLAVTGLVLGARSPVESDVAKLAPRGLAELRQTRAVERELGTAGELRIAIRAPDVTAPRVLGWMRTLKDRVLAVDRRLRPGPNLGELLAGARGSGPLPTRSEVARLMRVVPPYLLDPVLSHSHDRAELSFGVPLVSGAEQARLLDRIAPLRRLGDALVPLVPAVVGAGLAALVVSVLGLRLSPLSAALEPLGLAVGVEFGLLLDARYAEARRAGLTPRAAQEEAVRRIGGAVAVSAATVAAGFAVLVVSRLPLLQQFGALVALELVACAIAAIVLVSPLAAAVDVMRARRAAEPRRPARVVRAVTRN
jgi:predicted RND superfamily exporter protein